MNTTDARIGSYLDDLARMLADLDPPTRDDVLAGVREHLDAVLAENAGDPRAVDDALLRLSPPDRVAAEARADRPTSHPAWPPPGPSDNPAWARVAVVATLLSVVPPAATSIVDRLESLGAETIGAGWPVSIDLLGTAGAATVLLPLASPAWLAGIVATLVARALTGPARIALAALGPATVVAVVLASFWLSPALPSTVVSLVLLVGVLTASAGLARRAWREAGA
ncbi:MAG: HAAS signaling domain-containing protein [Dermatophilaceae bacterium]